LAGIFSPNSLKNKKNFTMESQQEVNLVPHLTKSKRGRDKLKYEGFGYNFKERNGEVLNWRCCKRNCKGFIKQIRYTFLFVLDVILTSEMKTEYTEKKFPNNEKTCAKHK
jgi:hypothetical protein